MKEIVNNLYSDFTKRQLVELLVKQLSGFFPVNGKEIGILDYNVDHVLERCFYCFNGIDNKYFRRNGQVIFSPYHSGQYVIFLYYFSNTCSNSDCKELADKLYYLNKILNSCDIYHELELPEVFFLEHPVGSVFGRAKYGNNFTAFQSCTVGGNKNKYPDLGTNFKMLSGSKILGNCIVGDNVTLAANTYVKDTNIPANATVFGMTPNLIFKYL